MVNQIVLEYLRVNRGNYKLEDLKKKILASGHSQQDIDSAIAQLNNQSGGNVPSVNATINKINKINIPLEQNTPTKSAPVGASKKSRKWLWISIILVIILAVVGVAIWYFLEDIKSLFI